MRYATGAAFRRALEDRLKRKALQSGVPLSRLRKAVAFERFVARLQSDRPEAWLLKGGFALQVRLGVAARHTLDVDLLYTSRFPDDLLRAMQESLDVPATDWFMFRLSFGGIERAQAGQSRFSVQALVDGRLFEAFHVDVGIGDPVVEEPDVVVVQSALVFAGAVPVAMRCYPISQHLAEKVHAYTLPRRTGESSRVKDLVDMVLIAESLPLQGTPLWTAIEATFKVRGTHRAPPSLPAPPEAWRRPYARIARDLAMRHTDLGSGYALARALLDPVLARTSVVMWHSHRGRWV